MAAARQGRKPAIWRGLWGWRGAACAAFLAMFAPALPIGAAVTELVVTDRNSGVAIFGFDPVAYFADGRPAQGVAIHEHRHAGVVWRFRNSGNRAAFAADPEVYAPRFGGYDPVDVARGVAVAGDPRVWVIADDRLYLFRSPENQAAFIADPARALTAAVDAWPATQRTLAP